MYPKKVKFGSTTLLKKEATAGNAGCSISFSMKPLSHPKSIHGAFWSAMSR